MYVFLSRQANPFAVAASFRFINFYFLHVCRKIKKIVEWLAMSSFFLLPLLAAFRSLTFILFLLSLLFILLMLLCVWWLYARLKKRLPFLFPTTFHLDSIRQEGSQHLVSLHNAQVRPERLFFTRGGGDYA